MYDYSSKLCLYYPHDFYVCIMAAYHAGMDNHLPNPPEVPTGSTGYLVRPRSVAGALTRPVCTESRPTGLAPPSLAAACL